MTCEAVRQKVDYFFALPRYEERAEAEKGLDRVQYNNITVGIVVEDHKRSCRPCWDYYQGLKREHFGR